LEAQSLVTRAEQSASFAVHPLVQDVTRRSLHGNGGGQHLKLALRWQYVEGVPEAVLRAVGFLADLNDPLAVRIEEADAMLK
jgi:hypothetical protein